MLVCLAGWDNGSFGSRSSIWQGKWQFSCVLRARKPLIFKGLQAFCIGNQAGKYERVSKFARRISGIFSCTSASSNLDLPPVNLRFSSLNCTKICSDLHLSHVRTPLVLSETCLPSADLRAADLSAARGCKRCAWWRYPTTRR